MRDALGATLGMSDEDAYNDLIWRPSPPFPDTPDPVTYFVQPSVGGPLKIGRSTWASLAGRVRDLQIGCAYKLELLLVVEGDREGRLHRAFADYRLSGEWFLPADAVARACGAARVKGEVDESRHAYDIGYDAGWKACRAAFIEAAGDVAGARVTYGEIASLDSPVDATYLACGTDELRRRAAEGDDRALAELARAAA